MLLVANGGRQCPDRPRHSCAGAHQYQIPDIGATEELLPSTLSCFPLEEGFAKRQRVLLAEANKNNLRQRVLLAKKL